MEIVEILAEILKYIVPAVLVLIAIKYLNDVQVEKEKVESHTRFKSELLKQQLPLKLSAYERAVLFLERISPMSILPRCGNGINRTAQQFHAELIQEIRSEFEHNLVQQIYISHHAWGVLVQAKEEMINIINIASKELNEEANGLDLSKKIIEKISTLQSLPTHKATFVLKSDVHKIFEV